MAVVGTSPATITHSAMRFRELRISPAETGGTEIAAEARPVARVIEEEKIHVAVGKSVKECKSVAVWAAQNSGGRRVCFAHVHLPSPTVPLMGARFQPSQLKEQEVRAYRELERQEMHRHLDKYILLCRKMGVRAEKLVIESESVEKGMVELISKYNIRRFVMGAAADRNYRRGMTEVRSRKAQHVRLQAPPSCHLSFVCKNHLVCEREARAGAYHEVGTLSQQGSPSPEVGLSNQMRSQSMQLRPRAHVRPTNPALDLLRRIRSVDVEALRRKAMSLSSHDEAYGLSTLQSRSDAEGSFHEFNEFSRSVSQNSVVSSCSSSGVSNGTLLPGSTTMGREFGLELSTITHQDGQEPESSPPLVLDETIEDPFSDHLNKAITEAMNSRREAFEEAVRRAKAERDAIEAIRKAKALESLYAEETKQRKEIEVALEKEKQGLENLKNERDGILEELQNVLNQKLSLERQIAESDETVKELEQKIISAVELLQHYKKEQDDLQLERDNALKEAQELRKSRLEASSSVHQPQFFSEFSFSEIEEATHNFNPSLKIGEGGYGSIYRGVLRHTPVAIKMLHSSSMQGPSEFQQEVEVLSKMRHPNLVTLIGACPEAWALVYEYLPNGSLEDRLACKDNSPPLSWQTRIRIATELCAVLIFLHSNKQHSIVHGDLKPANILLDANLVSKLSDFGICRLLYHAASSGNDTTFLQTGPKGTFIYMDPEFLASGELTSKSDVYSFGIILLRLLTGRPPLKIIKDVQCALDGGNLIDFLDPLAGDWPFVLAEQLAHLALRCCEMSRKSRPDLASEVWRVLGPMKASCGGSPCFSLGSDEHCQPPSYFVCPIFQEVMQDPQVAADGFTYEAEALRGWLDSGHDTSPMTNLKLAHCNLLPNRALRSAIQEWLPQQNP